MGQVILVCSGKGGTGKTGITAALAVAFGRKNLSVLAIDGALGFRNLDIVFGLENRVINNLIDVLEDKCELGAALVSDRKFPSVRLLPTAWMRPVSSLDEKSFKNLIERVRSEYDVILIDCPDNEVLFKTYISCSDRAVAVITGDVCCVRNADKTLRTLKSNSVRDISLIVNRFDYKKTASGIHLSIDDMTDLLAENVIGIIPECEAMASGINRGEPVTLDGGFVGKLIDNVASRMLGEVIPLTSVKKLARYNKN
ncbi:MAG: AAA family ATPase [Lachnospiraceae bacterium]|nr:AAA family ATPase [Lachnospiraceae bacterium]